MMKTVYERSGGKFGFAFKTCGTKAEDTKCALIYTNDYHTGGTFFCLECNDWVWKIENILIAHNMAFESFFSEQSPQINDYFKEILGISKVISAELRFDRNNNGILAGSIIFLGNPDKIFEDIESNPIVLQVSKPIPLRRGT